MSEGRIAVDLVRVVNGTEMGFQELQIEKGLSGELSSSSSFVP